MTMNRHEPFEELQRQAWAQTRTVQRLALEHEAGHRQRVPELVRRGEAGPGLGRDPGDQVTLSVAAPVTVGP